MGWNYYGTYATIPRSDFYRRAGWEYKFAWLPKRCVLSDKFVWLRYAYKGTAMWTGPGEPVFEYVWHSSKEHIIWKLKGN